MKADQLPDYLDTKEIREAVAIKDSFTEDERRQAVYMSRLEAKRVAATDAAENRRTKAALEQALKREKQALKREELERVAKEKALKREEKYLKILRENNLDPDRLS